MKFGRWLGIVIVVFVLCYLIVVSPQRDALAEQENRESELKMTFEIKQRNFVHLEPLKQHLRELQQLLGDMYAMLPGKFDEAEERQTLINQAEKHDINIEHLSFDERRLREFHFDVAFELTVSGDFFKVYRFFHDNFHASGRAVSIDSANVRSYAEGDNIQIALSGRSIFYLEGEDQ